ncbi:uncharacterized protein [Miscanthus floridulus]|uniref:uncharacterized protein n=1 Tax=Miscanthus floridulus TaxID=154761 RepID=UPI003457F2C5
MHASRTRMMLPVVLSLCAVALLLSPVSADPESLGAAVGGGDSWPVESPAEAPTGVAATLKWTEDDVADGIGVPLPPGRQALRPRLHTSALSPDARRGLDHEARCGPRVSVGRGVSQWPGWKPRCRGGATHDGDASAPAVHRLPPLFDER